MDKRKIILISIAAAIIAVVAIVIFWLLFKQKPKEDAYNVPPTIEGEYRLEVSGQKQEYHTSYLLIKFKQGTNDEQIKLFEQDEKLQLVRKSRRTGLIRYKFDEASGEDIEKRIAKYKNLSFVESVEKDVVSNVDFTPNDPLFLTRQWQYNGTIAGSIRMQDVWDQQTVNNTVVVAVLDTGVAYENYVDPNPANCYTAPNPCMPAGTAYQKAPDLAGTNFWINGGESPGDGIDNDGNGYIDDVSGWDFVNSDNHPNDGKFHGTFVTGAIAQTTNEAYGSVGGSFGVTIMPVKVLPDKGSGSGLDVIDGIYYAADEGADVINLSLGSSVFSSDEQDAVNYAVSQGVAVIASTGNDGIFTERYPASYANVIAVGATNSSKNKACYSNSSNNIDITAPGGQNYIEQCQSQAAIQARGCPFDGTKYYCTSACCTPIDLDANTRVDGFYQQGFVENQPTNFGYFFGNGTSYSTPVISAAAALLLSRDSSLTPAQLKSHLETTADDLGPAGWDTENGAGFVNILSALAAVAPAPCIDTDSDGYGNPASALCTQSTLDCDNANPAIHPGVIDACGNGVDEDCSGSDAVCAPICTDSDSDGYGNPASATCVNPSLDCVDSNPGIHPGAVEICGNGVDENCNGSDLACPAVCNNNIIEGAEVCDGTAPFTDTCISRGFTGGTLSCKIDCTFDISLCTSPPPCTDGDSDGYGSPASATCAKPTLDCDDTESSIHPDAPDICGNSIDEDCGGSDSICAVGAAGFANWQFITGTDEKCDPVIQTIIPVSRSYDDIVGYTINGYNFGMIASEVIMASDATVNDASDICLDNTLLNTGGASALCMQNWGSTQIQTRVPARGGLSNGAITGDVKVSVAGVESNSASFTVASPHVNSLSPSAGPKGRWITLKGTDFGAASGIIRFIRRSDNTIVNGNFPCGSTGWTDTRIIVELPIDSLFNIGDALEIQIERSDGRHGNFGVFTVNGDPLGPGICVLSESCGESGTLFNITGKRFGAAQGASNVIFKGAAETNADYTDAGFSWSDEAINNVKTPAALADGSYDIIVRVPALSDSNGIRFNKPCAGTPCDADTTTPACEPDGGVCAALGPTYSCNPATCRCNNNPLPKVVEQNSCTFTIQSPSPYRDQIEACLNSIVSVRFNNDMDDATVIKNNILVENCANDSSCSAPVPIDITAWLMTPLIAGPEPGEEMFALMPNPILVSNIFYRITLKQDIKSASGYQLDGNKNNSADISPNDNYSWIFKTSNDSCKVKSIALSPANMSVAVSSSKPISAIPQAENCNAVVSYASQWNWTSADAPTATVSTNDNELLMGLIDPVQQVTGNKAGTTIVSASMPAEPVVPAGISNITVTNKLSCSDAGLTAVWKFDEAAGDAAVDSTNNNNQGVLRNSPTRLFTGCKFGKCLSFDGTNQYVAVKRTTALNTLVDGNHTFEMWVRSNETAITKRLFTIEDTTSGFHGVIFNFPTAGKVAFYDGSAADPDALVSIASNLNDGAWHHLSFVLDGTMQRIYIDGNFDNSRTKVVGAELDSDFFIGTRNSFVEFFNGKIDEVRIWNKALDISEIKSIYNQQCEALDKISCSDPNLKAVWKLDENSGIAANDSTANNNDGQLNNNPSWRSGADCKSGYGSCLSFDGVDDYIKMPDSDSVSITSAITMEAWIKTSDAGQRYIFSKHKVSGVPEEYEYTLLLNPGGIIRAEFRKGPLAGDYISALGTSNAADGNWHHIAATFDGNNIKIYNNGILESTTPWANNISSTVAKYLFIGQLGDNTRYFNGLIDEPRIWDKALTQEEIISAMSQSCLAGSVGKGVISCTNDVVGVWNFDEGNGTLAADGSRNKKSGSLMNGATWNTTSCQFGNCLNFDGANDYVKLPDVFLSTPKAMTVEGWFKTTTAAQSMLFSINSYSMYINRGGQPNGSLLPFFDNNSTGDPGWGDYNDGNWHYFAATTNGSATSLYVDGEFINSRPENISQRLDGAAVGVIYDASANWYNGSIDELRVWSRVLSAVEIKANYQKSMTQCVEAALYCSNPELTAVWKMDEGIGVVAGDSTANNLDGALRNGLNNTGWKKNTATDSTICKFGKCLEFDGIDNQAQGDYVQITDKPEIDFGTNPFTVEGWITMPTSNTANATIISKQSGGGNPGFALATNTACDDGVRKLYFAVNDASNPADDNHVICSSKINGDEWHHFAAVREGATLRMYIDGVRAGEKLSDGTSLPEVAAASPINVDNNYPLYIGVYRNGIDDGGPAWHAPFKGSLDELRIWKKALTDNQIQSIYNGGNGQQCLAPQKGSACDLDLAVPMCQPNTTLCESSDPNLRCSIKSCTCQSYFAVVPSPDVTEDSSGGTACRNTAITVNFNENIDASTVTTAKTTYEVGAEIMTERFDVGNTADVASTLAALPGWTNVDLLTESPHWNPYAGSSPEWRVNSGRLYEQHDEGSGLFIWPGPLPTITNYRMSFDAEVLIGTEAVGFVFGYIDDKNYYQLLWSDPQDEYTNLVPTRLVLRKKVNGTFTDLAEKGDYAATPPVVKNFVVEVRGSEIIISSGGQTLISYNDSQSAAIALNKVGFYTHDNDGGVAYDNLVINEIAPTLQIGTVILAAYQPATGNLLADGDMEGANTDIWQQYATPKIIEKSTVEKKSGKQSLRIVTDSPICDICGGTEGVAINLARVNAGDRIRLKGWVKVIKGRFTAAIEESTGAWDTRFDQDGATDWKEFTVDRTANVSAPLTLWFSTLAGVADSEFYVDDVSVAIERIQYIDISANVNENQMIITPKQYLDPNRNYSVMFVGSSNQYSTSTNVLRSSGGIVLTPNWIAGLYRWTGLTTGTEICKIGRAEIQFTKNSAIGSVTSIGNDTFTCTEASGKTCADDMDTADIQNDHNASISAYAVNGGLLGGVLSYKWTPSTDAPFSVNSDNAKNIVVTAKPTNGRGSLTAKIDGGSAGSAETTAQIVVSSCENPWIGDLIGGAPTAAQSSVPWTESSTKFSIWYCRDSGNIQDKTDDLPNLTVQEVIVSPGEPKPLKEFFYYDDGNTDDAIGVRVYANLENLSLSDWLNENTGVSGGTSKDIDGWPAIQAGRSLYVAAANDTGTVVYTNVYLISYSDKASQKLVGIYNQMVNNWRFAINVSDIDNADPKFTSLRKLQRDIHRILDKSMMVKALDNYFQTNGKYPDLPAGSYIPGHTTSLWPSWQVALGNALNMSIPKDPINVFGECSGYNPDTCWNEQSQTFAGDLLEKVPDGTLAYTYKSENNGSAYGMCIPHEYAGWKFDNTCFENILTNVNFEAGVIGGVPTGWSESHQSHSSVGISAAEKRSGNQSVLLHQDPNEPYPGVCEEVWCSTHPICGWDSVSRTCNQGITSCSPDIVTPTIRAEGQDLCWGATNRVMWGRLAYNVSSIPFEAGKRYTLRFYYKGTIAANLDPRIVYGLGHISQCVGKAVPYVDLAGNCTWGTQCPDDPASCCAHVAAGQTKCYEGIYFPNISSGTYNDWTLYQADFTWTDEMASHVYLINPGPPPVIGVQNEFGVAFGYNNTGPMGTDFYVDDFKISEANNYDCNCSIGF